MQKYKFTGITKEVYGLTLNQIVCVTAFASIKSGEIGGYIEKEANLSQDGNAWVCGNAEVYGNAKVYGNAGVYGNAKVCGDAEVCEDAEVYGNAEVCGDAKVCGNAKVCGDAWVYGNAWVCGNAKVCGDAEVCEDAGVCGNAKVYGEAILRRGFTEKVTDYIVIGPQGTRSSFATFHLNSKTVCTGCFVGNLNEFKKAVYKTHNPDQGRVTFNNQYQRVIRVFEFLQEQDKDAQ
jgi:carbonic anhydrase/acetyltransferase-like protein (isoleucine patch superfamily)